jgi:hypothetical protein
MAYSKLENKLLIIDKKFNVFIDVLSDDYEVISYKEFILSIIYELMDKICVNSSLCVNFHQQLNTFQLSEIVCVFNKYFGTHCLERTLIAKNIAKKILIYDIDYDNVITFFKRHGFVEFNGMM